MLKNNIVIYVLILFIILIILGLYFMNKYNGNEKVSIKEEIKSKDFDSVLARVEYETINTSLNYIKSSTYLPGTNLIIFDSGKGIEIFDLKSNKSTIISTKELKDKLGFESDYITVENLLLAVRSVSLEWQILFESLTMRWVPVILHNAKMTELLPDVHYGFV